MRGTNEHGKDVARTGRVVPPVASLDDDQDSHLLGIVEVRTGSEKFRACAGDRTVPRQLIWEAPVMWRVLGRRNSASAAVESPSVAHLETGNGRGKKSKVAAGSTALSHRHIELVLRFLSTPQGKPAGRYGSRHEPWHLTFWYFSGDKFRG
jgi:hypothetical protein